MSKLISIIDYEMGNVQSVSNAFELLGADVEITNDPNRLKDSDAIVLPGVGAFKEGMKNLEEKGFLPILHEEVIKKEKPYLGICLGLELLAERSFEGGNTKGFGWIKGEIKKINVGQTNLKIPHMGWNDTKIRRDDGLLKDMKNPIFYYLHSYYFDVNKVDNDYIESICDYGDTTILASIQKKNIHAVQFHPEKSQESGLKLLYNFINLVK